MGGTELSMPGRRARGQNIKRLFGINILNTAFTWHAFDFTPRARVQAVGTELWRAEQGTHRPPRSDRFSGVPARGRWIQYKAPNSHFRVLLKPERYLFQKQTRRVVKTSP